MQSPKQSEREEILRKFLDDEAAQQPHEHEAYLQYYERIFGLSPNGFSVSIDTTAFSNHATVRVALDRLTGDIEQTAREFKTGFATAGPDRQIDDATRALLRVAFMIDSGSEESLPQKRWSEEQSFCAFAESCFLIVKSVSAHQADIQEFQGHRRDLRAWNLARLCAIKLLPTDDLAEHLELDMVQRTLKVFRHVSFLQAHLRRSQSEEIDLDFTGSLKK